MEKNQNGLLKLSYFISLLCTIAIIYFKLKQEVIPDILMFAGIVTTIAFIVLGIKEVTMRMNFTKSEKLMWIFSFIFFYFFSGAIYFLLGRKEYSK